MTTPNSREDAEALIDRFSKLLPIMRGAGMISDDDIFGILDLARLGLRVKWPSEEDVNAMAVAICKVNDSEPFAMTYITESGISQPYGERWMHDIPCARAALSALTEQQ